MFHVAVDGVGLAIIAACTLFDAFHEWRDTFQYHYEENYQCLTLWVTGRVVQVLALLLLMTYAASLNTYPILEVLGMSLLTAGPMMCMSASLLFNTEHDASLGDNFGIEWFLEEALELSGILFLDLSYKKMSNELELAAEVLGFFLLGCAAILDFNFKASNAIFPEVSYRFDMIHGSDAFGLILLTMVGIADYRARCLEEERELLTQAADSDGYNGLIRPSKYSGDSTSPGKRLESLALLEEGLGEPQRRTRSLPQLNHFSR